MNRPTPQELALDHAADIVLQVSATFDLPVDELALDAASSFESDSGDGSMSFFVRHKTGLYGVNAFPQPDGALGKVTVANLQSAFYSQPEESPGQ